MGYIECPHGGRCCPGKYPGECEYCETYEDLQESAEKKAAGVHIVVPVGEITLSQTEFYGLLETQRQNE